MNCWGDGGAALLAVEKELAVELVINIGVVLPRRSVVEGSKTGEWVGSKEAASRSLGVWAGGIGWGMKRGNPTNCAFPYQITC